MLVDDRSRMFRLIMAPQTPPFPVPWYEMSFWE